MLIGTKMELVQKLRQNGQLKIQTNNMKKHHPFFIAFCIFGALSLCSKDDFNIPAYAVIQCKVEAIISLISLAVAATIYFPEKD